MDYRKYKPLTANAKCTDCNSKNVIKAYRALCDDCATRKREVPVPKDGVCISDLIITNELTGNEEIPDSVKDQFEMQVLKRCSKCCVDVKQYAMKVQTAKDIEKDELKQSERMVEIINSLKERQKRTITRKLKNGEIDYDKELDKFVYVGSGEEF